MNNNGFTEKQKEQLKILNRKYSFKSFWLIGRCVILLFLSQFLISLTDILYVHSKVFVFITSFASGVLFSQLLIDNMRFLVDSLKKDTLKILEDKEQQ
jgi:hypothetical protein